MSDESYPEELHYHEAHDWVKVDGDTATFGITWYAQDTLGEVDGLMSAAAYRELLESL